MARSSDTDNRWFFQKIDWISVVKDIGLFGILCDIALILSNSIGILLTNSYSGIEIIQIYLGGILGLFFCSLLVYGSQKKNTLYLIAWIILHILNIIWGCIENSWKMNGLEDVLNTFWIIISLILIGIVWKAKTQIDEEKKQQDIEESKI